MPIALIRHGPDAAVSRSEVNLSSLGSKLVDTNTRTTPL